MNFYEKHNYSDYILKFDIMQSDMFKSYELKIDVNSSKIINMIVCKNNIKLIEVNNIEGTFFLILGIYDDIISKEVHSVRKELELF